MCFIISTTVAKTPPGKETTPPGLTKRPLAWPWRERPFGVVREDATLDFEAQPLADSEVFLITGKIGSVKSRFEPWLGNKKQPL